MKARNVILTIAALAIVAAPTTVLAQRGPGDCPGPHGPGPQGPATGDFFGGPGGDHLGFFERGLPRMAEDLGLSDEQLEKIQAVIDATRPKIEDYAEQLQKGREAYRAANKDLTAFNEKEFREHALAQHEIQTDLMVAVRKAKAEIFSILTPEQREQLEEMRGSFGPKSSRRGGRRPRN
jgi:Spy/CpxP family protein refolding chaperone